MEARKQKRKAAVNANAKHLQALPRQHLKAHHQKEDVIYLAGLPKIRVRSVSRRRSRRQNSIPDRIIIRIARKRVQIVMNGTDLLLWRKTNSFRLTTLQWIREKTNKQTTGKGVSLEIDIVGTSEDDVVFATTHEVVSHGRG
jgi:hypothetical protein